MQGQRVLATSLSVEIVGLHNVLLQVMRTGCEAPIQTFLVQFPDADSHPKIGMIGFNANCADTVLQANRIPQTLCERSKIFQVLICLSILSYESKAENNVCTLVTTPAYAVCRVQGVLSPPLVWEDAGNTLHLELPRTWHPWHQRHP